MVTEEIQEELFRLQDKRYRDFQRRLIPTSDPDAIIGVRTPDLRKYARQLAKREDIPAFLNDLPHRCFDENQLHAFLLSELKDYSLCVAEVDRFLPFIDNWATCDQLSPKVFRKHRHELLESIKIWIRSEEPFTVRFAVGMLMEHFLDEDFDPAYPRMVAGVRSEAYYVHMMIAWYFATALAKQYEAALPFLKEHRLSAWTHNKAIQKAVESSRITAEQKEYLKSLKVKKTQAGYSSDHRNERKTMKHCGTQRLETERLILRRFVPEDAEAMYRNWASDREVTKFLTWPAHASVEVTQAVLKSWLPSYQKENYYQWAIVLKENGSEPIGSISAVEINDDLSTAHIGYCLGRPWWHQGIMSEALQAVIDFFFDRVDARRIESRHDPRNPHSGMVMKKCGMQYEGTMRSADRNNQGICDACWYAILKSDR